MRCGPQIGRVQVPAEEVTQCFLQKVVASFSNWILFFNLAFWIKRVVFNFSFVWRDKSEFGGAIKIYRFLSDTICGRFAWENAHRAH